MKMLIVSALSFLFVASAHAAKNRFVCVSVIDSKTVIREVALSEYASASISYQQGQWSYAADVFEGKVNSLQMFYRPLKLSSRAFSITYPLDHLATQLEAGNLQASVDCDLR